MDTINPRTYCGDGGGNRESTIVVTMPIDLDVLARVLDDVLHKANKVRCAGPCCMPDRIGKDDAPCPAFDCRCIDLLDVIGMCTRGIFGDKHARQAVTYNVLYGILRELKNMGNVPPLDVLTDRTCADEGRYFDGNACFLRDVDDRVDIRFDGSCRAVGKDLHVAAGNLFGKLERIVIRPRSCTRQTDVRRLDAQVFHEMEDFDFLVDRRVCYRR